jgi:hypothetical protein
LNDVAPEPIDHYERRLDRLRAAIAEGEEAEGVPWTPQLMEQILRNADERQRRGETPIPMFAHNVCP